MTDIQKIIDEARDEETRANYLERFTYGYAYGILFANTTEVDTDGNVIRESVDPADWQTPSPDWPLKAFDVDSRNMMREDCADFVQANWEILRTLFDDRRILAWDAGMDFALIRNRHGAGYWDRGLDEDGRKLTEAAHVYGESRAESLDGIVRLY
jgi:hypothetical protein